MPLTMKAQILLRGLTYVAASLGVCGFMACGRAGPAGSQLRPTATIKDIMDGIVDPSADLLWESVATVESAAGTEERQPQTEQEWTAVRRSAVALVEATNLLVMEGRRVAKPGENAERPEVEMSADQIDAAISHDREAWITLAHALHDTVMPALHAIEDRNARALLDAGEAIDAACENCHLKYWYPPNRQAPRAKARASAPSKPAPNAH